MGKQFLYYLMVLLFLGILSGSCEETQDGDNLAEALEGEWKVDENSEFYKSGQATYNVYITLSTQDSSTVYIANFYQLGYDNEIVGSIGDDRIQLEAGQEASVLNSVYTIVSGRGTIATDYQSIGWEYEVDDGSGSIDHVTATYSRVK
jgi:hypothetical protein